MGNGATEVNEMNACCKRQLIGAALVLILIIPLACVAGCSSTDKPPPAMDGIPPVAERSRLDTSFNILPPSQLKLPATTSTAVMKYGMYYETGIQHERVAPTADQSCQYEPNFAGTSAELAYAVYVFDIGDYLHHNTLKLDWNVVNDYADCYVGLADFDRDRWDFFDVTPVNTITFNGVACVDDGMAYVIVLLTGTDTWELNRLYFGAVRPPDIVGVQTHWAHQGETIAFKPVLRTAPTGETSWTWDFGGGATPNAPAVQVPEVNVGSPGVYSCEVSAENLAGTSILSFYLTSSPAGWPWHIEAVCPFADHGVTTSIALEPDTDTPWLAAPDPLLWDLYISRFDGTIWDSDVIDLPYNPFRDCVISNDTMAFDGEGVAHFTCYRDPWVKYATYQDGAWNVEDAVDSTEGLKIFTYYAPSLAFDADDRPFVAYSGDGAFDTTDESLVGIGRVTGTDHWSQYAVDFSFNYPYTIYRQSPMDVDQDGLASVLCHDSGPPDQVRISTTDPGWTGWSTTLVMDGSGVGALDIAVSKNDGTPFICYGDEVGPGINHLFYGYRDGGGWHLSDVSGAGNIGDYVSMVLDSDDHPHIGYYEQDSGDMRYANYDGADWSVATIDAEGNVGIGCDIALDAEGNPHFSYFDETAGFVKYAYLSDE